MNHKWDIPFIKYCNEGNLELAALYLKKGADINASESKFPPGDHFKKWQGTSLHYACMENNAEMVGFLLEHGADVNAKDENGETPLQLLSENGSHQNSIKICKMLLNTGANIDDADKNGMTSLHWAAKYASSDYYDLLIQSGADENATNKAGQKPLDIADPELVARHAER